MFTSSLCLSLYYGFNINSLLFLRLLPTLHLPHILSLIFRLLLLLLNLFPKPSSSPHLLSLIYSSSYRQLYFPIWSSLFQLLRCVMIFHTTYLHLSSPVLFFILLHLLALFQVSFIAFLLPSFKFAIPGFSPVFILFCFLSLFFFSSTIFLFLHSYCRAIPLHLSFALSFSTKPPTLFYLLPTEFSSFDFFFFCFCVTSCNIVTCECIFSRRFMRCTYITLCIDCR